jgi:hypothetical protein
VLFHRLVQRQLALDKGELGHGFHHSQHTAKGVTGDTVHGLVPSPAVAQVDVGVANEIDGKMGQVWHHL